MDFFNATYPEHRRFLAPCRNACSPLIPQGEQTTAIEVVGEHCGVQRVFRFAAVVVLVRLR